MGRERSIKPWTQNHKQIGWAFHLGRDENGNSDVWRFWIENLPTIEDVRLGIEKLEVYWKRLKRNGIQAWTREHRVLALEEAELWGKVHTPDPEGVLARWNQKELERAKWVVQQEQKMRQALKEATQQWEAHAYRETLKAVSIKSAVASNGVVYIVAVDLWRMNPLPTQLQVQLFAPFPRQGTTAQT